MRDLRWQILIAVGGLILVALLLFRETSPLAPSAPQPVSGGAHTEALIGQAVRLNPILDDFNQVDRDINELLYSGLVRFDDRGNPQPDLADSWGVSADAKLYTVHIREDAVWHDGQPVTSADITYTYSKYQDEDFPGDPAIQEFWEEIAIVQLDDHTVQFQLPEPFAPFLDFLSEGLLPDHLLRGASAGDLIDHPFNTQPVGTGPFQFDQFLMDDGQITGVNLTANEDYHLEEPFLERVEFRFFESTQAAFAAYEREEVRAIGRVDERILPDVLAARNLNLHTARLPETTLIYLNLNHPEKTFLADRAVRRSLQQAINRQAIVDRVMNGQAVPAKGPVLPGNWAYASDLPPIEFDPIAAAEQLDEAEWLIPEGAAPGGEDYVRSKEELPFSITLLYGPSEIHAQIAGMVADYWRSIGVSVEVEQLEDDELQDALEERDFEAALTELDLGRYPDPDPYPLWHDSQAETGQNYSGFSDRNSGIWIEQARTTNDRTRRAELYQSFQHRFLDQVPAILLFHPVYNYAISAEMRGVAMGPIQNPSDRFNNIHSWYLIARRSPLGQDPTDAVPADGP